MPRASASSKMRFGEVKARMPPPWTCAAGLSRSIGLAHAGISAALALPARA
jgi:hypothetical protein